MFRFDSSYPISAPAVQFVVDQGSKAPVHPVSESRVELWGNIWRVVSMYTPMDMWAQYLSGQRAVLFLTCGRSALLSLELNGHQS
jgi:hypothetical protein